MRHSGAHFRGENHIYLIVWPGNTVRLSRLQHMELTRWQLLEATKQCRRRSHFQCEKLLYVFQSESVLLKVSREIQTMNRRGAERCVTHANGVTDL